MTVAKPFIDAGNLEASVNAPPPLHRRELHHRKPTNSSGVVELRYWNDGLSSVTNATSNSVQFSVQNQAYKDCMRNNFGKTQVTDKINAIRIAFQ